MFVLIMLMWIKYTKNIQILGDQAHLQCEKNILTLIVSKTRRNKCEWKKEFLRCCEFSCRDFMCKWCFENIDTDITNFFQYSDHDKNSSNIKNEASDADSDSNSYDELLEPYISYDNDLPINEIGNHTNN